MWTKFSSRTDVRLPGLMLVLALAPAYVLADKKSDLDQQARQAAAVGDAAEAARLYCAEADLDSSNQQLREICAEMKNEAARELKRSDQRFSEGVQAFNNGDWDGAEQKFKNIRTGPHLDEARRYLQQVIPAARTQAESDRAMEQKFLQGKQAYQNNDFSSAKPVLGQVTGTHASEAQDYLSHIRQFEQQMAQGDSLAANKDYKSAALSYTEAANIKADGPGDPRGKAARMQSLMAAAPVHDVPAPSPSIGPNNAPRRRISEAALKPGSAPVLDIARLLRDAQSAQKRGAYLAAMGKYAAVLVADPHNAEARAALEDLKTRTSGSTERASADADVMLAKAIREFYTGEYEDAEVHIKDYLGYKGSRAALSYFYLGVCKATRFYLGGEQEQDKRLLDEARDAFHHAKAGGFTPPDEKYISPKILQIYQQS
jgi:hypothetical protein